MAVETVKYIAAVSRMVRAAGPRVADGDEPELRALLALQDVVAETIQVAVDGQRSYDRSWAYIARATGRSREAAFKRWGKTKEVKK